MGVFWVEVGLRCPSESEGTQKSETQKPIALDTNIGFFTYLTQKVRMLCNFRSKFAQIPTSTILNFDSHQFRRRSLSDKIFFFIELCRFYLKPLSATCGSSQPANNLSATSQPLITWLPSFDKHDQSIDRHDFLSFMNVIALINYCSN